MSSAQLAAASTILTGLRATAQLASLPHPVIILGLVDTIVQTVNDSKNVTDDLYRLAARMIESAQVIIPALSRQNAMDDPILVASAARLVKSIEALGVSVQRLLARGKLQQFFSGPGTRLALKQAESDFEYAVELFILQLRTANLLLGTKVLKPADNTDIKNAIEEAQREQLEHIERKLSQSAPPKPTLARQALPVQSSIFSGRETELEHIVQQLTGIQPGYVSLLGPGGIGKTSLALSVLHDPRIVDEFSERRYFVACEAVENVEALLETFARTVGATQQSPIKSFRKLVTELDQPVLVTLDNLETCWEPTGKREKVEGFLGELAGIPKVSLVVTLRGAERPYGIAWSRPVLPPLQPIDEKSAVEVYIAISDGDEQDPFLVPLLRSVDMIPLAVTLLATQGQYMSCEELLEKWNEQKTDMVTRGYDGRLSSLDVSINLSLQSPRFFKDPAAKRLLQLLSLLPDGATEMLIAAILGKDFPLDTAAMSLIRTSLSYRGEEGKTRTLSPIREHVLRYLPPSDADVRLIFGYFYDFLLAYEKNLGTAVAREMSVNVVPILGNLRSIVSYCLTNPDVAGAESVTHAASLSFVLHRYQSNSDPTLESLQKAADIASERGLRLQEAYCLYNFATTNSDLENFERPIALFRETKCHEGLVNGLRSKALQLNVMDRPAEALVVCKEAEAIDFSLVSKRTASLFYQQHGKVLSCMGRPVESLAKIRQAFQVAEEGQAMDAIAHITTWLSRTEAKRGNYGAAYRLAESALQYSVNPEAFMGIALVGMADALQERCAVPETEQLLKIAIQVFEHIGQLHWATTVEATMGYLRLYAGLIEEALDYLNKSARIWQGALLLEISYLAVDIESQEYEKAKQRLPNIRREQLKSGNIGNHGLIISNGELLFRTGREAQALSDFLLMCIISSSPNPYRLGLAMSILRLGDVLWAGYDDIETAKSCYQTSLNLMKHLGTPRHQADCLMRIGLVELLAGRTGIAKSKFSYARDLSLLASFPVGVKICEERLIPACDEQESDASSLGLSDLLHPHSLGLMYLS